MLFTIVNLRDRSFDISLNSLGFYLSPGCLLNFLWLNIPPCVREIFELMMFTFLENALNLCIFTHTPVPHSKLEVEFFENMFPPRRKEWGKIWLALSKFNHKIWRWLETLVYLYFFVICNFSKCDSFTVLWIIFIKYYGIKFTAFSLEPW